MAAEERGGRGKRTLSGKGREARASARMRAPSSSSSQAWASDRARPAPTVRTLEKEESRYPSSPRRDLRALPRVPHGGASSLFFFSGALGGRERKHVSLLCSFPLPHEKWDGRSWACQGESAPGFPAHFNSVSASTARRFTASGAPEPSAGTRSASPTRLSPAVQSGSSDLFSSAPPARVSPPIF